MLQVRDTASSNGEGCREPTSVSGYSFSFRTLPGNRTATFYVRNAWLKTMTISKLLVLVAQSLLWHPSFSPRCSLAATTALLYPAPLASLAELPASAGRFWRCSLGKEETALCLALLRESEQVVRPVGSWSRKEGKRTRFTQEVWGVWGWATHHGYLDSPRRSSVRVTVVDDA